MKMEFYHKNSIRSIILLFTISILFSCHSPRDKKQQVTVFCAASLTDVFTDLKNDFEKENQVDIKLNLASSGTLARQIEQGAPADIFLSANKKWMDYTEESGLTEKETIKEIAANSLVIVVPKNSVKDTIPFVSPDFSQSFNGLLSIGDPAYVPAGTYAREAMENAGIFNSVKDRLLPAKDVRSALMVVEMGETEAGIVYKTDALKSEKVKIAGEIPENLHQAIKYTGAILKGHKSDLTAKFYTFITSEEGI